VRIWAVESEYDAAVVKCLGEKLAAHFQLDLSILSSGSKAFNDAFHLEKAVRNYLMQVDCVIFVLDCDSEITKKKKRQERNSLLSQIKRVLQKQEFEDCVFEDCVFLIEAVNEIEAWLLVDCIGIFIYFAHNHHSLPKECQNYLKQPEEDRAKCRERLMQNKVFSGLINRYQKGDTETIEESVPGGKGAKEYLEKFSEEIIETLNPGIKNKTKEAKKYKENRSPELAKYIEINEITLNRNNSLKNIGLLIKKCSEMP
jgi:hypothetical protein